MLVVQVVKLFVSVVCFFRFGGKRLAILVVKKMARLDEKVTLVTYKG